MLNPNEISIYAALAGAALDVDDFALGHGVVLSRVAVHIPAESLVDLLPSTPEVNHAALKALARSGPGLDLCGQLYVPAELRPQRGLDRVNTVWWITTLLRLRCTPELRVPLLSSDPFSGEAASRERAEHWPVETELRRLCFEPGVEPRIREEDLRWVEAHWFHAGRLIRRPPFNRAMKHLDRAFLMTDAPAALLTLWASLEALLGTPDRDLPQNVAAFLEPPGETRRELAERLIRMPEEPAPAEDFLVESYPIVKRVLLKVIEEERVPTREEIEAGRFVGLN